MAENWYDAIPDARIRNRINGPRDSALLEFKTPTGENHVIPVTTGPGTNRTETHGPTWTITGNLKVGDIATVSPSIHYVGHFHTDNPVQFRITEIV